MAKVKILKEDVYKKIAAGEVVERPLSVVKELVENSIDAGADAITVEIQEGGKRLIKISDNGSGFDPEDIEQAFKNHSTSKLTELSDFDTLRTLGFRGEALPSILEVSVIHIETSNNDDGFGLRCVFENGQLKEKEEIACNRGTTIAVRDLFYNFPVRKKFLKTERTELNQIISFLEPVALVNFEISFELVHNGKTVFIYKKADHLKERIYQVFGKDFLDDLQEVDFVSDSYGLNGFVSRLNTGASVKKHQYFFVNRRPVREKTLIAALNNSFERYLEKHRYPVGILLLTIPPGEVDVNIHPMKLEIKFEDSNRIYRFIKHAIDSAFSGHTDIEFPEISLPGVNFSPFRGDPVVDFSRGRSGAGYGSGKISGSIPGAEAQMPYIPPAGRTGMEPRGDYDQAQLFAGSFLNEEEFILIGQFKNSYILVEKGEELLIIDQHNAQERVNFDRLKQQYQENKVVSISPLFPVILELSPSESGKLNDEKMAMLEKIGFRLEPLSGNSFDVKAFPQVLEERNIRDTVLEILHMPEDQVNVEDKVLAEVACKSAIKVNHKLYPDQMKAIVKNLFKTSNPYFCPHKRPIIIDFTLEDIEKRLKRK
jgi:DNA mismatch repair protein MutL